MDGEKLKHAKIKTEIENEEEKNLKIVKKFTYPRKIRNYNECIKDKDEIISKKSEKKRFKSNP